MSSLSGIRSSRGCKLICVSSGGLLTSYLRNRHVRHTNGSYQTSSIGQRVDLHRKLTLGQDSAQINSVGRVYQQTFVDTYSKWATAKLYTTKTPITSADLLNDRVLPFFAEQGMGVIRILTDRGTEFCGKAESHDYQLYLALNDIEHTKTKVMHPQTNGICERFHKTILQEFYQVTFRRKIYRSIEELQSDLDEWLKYYNYDRTHQGKMCCGRTPMETLIDGKEVWKDKITNLNN